MMGFENIFQKAGILLFCLLYGVAVWAADGPSAAAGRVIGEASFQTFLPLKVPPWGQKALQRKKIPETSLQRQEIAPRWNVDWGTWTADCRLAGSDSGWLVSGPQGLSVYGRLCFCRSRNVRFVLTVEGLEEPARIGLGSWQCGMIRQERRSLKEWEIPAGKTVTVEAEDRFDFGVAPFWPVIQVNGKVRLKKLQIIALPDDPAEVGISVVEGVVKARSALPNPKKSDYPDCRYTLEFEGNAILSGVACPQKIQLIVEGFRQYKTLPSATLKVGDKLRCQVIPFDKLPEAQKSTQQTDDLSLFELESFYLLECEKINTFSDDSAVDFTDTGQNYVSVFERKINPPLTEQEKRLQAESIRSELARINALLEGWDKAKIRKIESEFQAAWEREKTKDKPGYNRVRGYVWRNVDNSFWCLPEKYQLLLHYSPIRKENMAALVAFRDFLEIHGCQLIVSPVPDFYAIAARVINPEFRAVPDFLTALTVRELLENDIETFYASDAMIRNFNRYPWAYFYPANGHPSDTAQDIQAELMAQRLLRYQFRPTLAKGSFSVEHVPHIYKDDPDYRFPANCDIGGNRPETSYLCRQILYDQKVIDSDPVSPVFAIGNSFLQTPMTMPMSFPSLLTSKIRIPITSLYVAAGGPMTAIVQQMFLHPEKFLKGKKVVVLQIGAGHFHGTTTYNNIRLMDRQKMLLTGKQMICTIPVSGNTSEVPKFGKDLRQAHFFTIPAEKQCDVAKYPLPQNLIGKDAVLEIPVCAQAATNATLLVNGCKVHFAECYAQYRWCKSVCMIPAGTTQIKVELNGAPGTAIAIGDLKIYQ